MNDSLNTVLRLLPERVCRAVLALPERVCGEISEIRLRAGAPVSLTLQGGDRFLGECGICKMNNSLHCSHSEISECVSRLTGGSLYTYDEFISRGFIPLSDGGRAGLCGRALINGGRVDGFSEVTGIVLRVSRFVPDFALPLAETFSREGVCGTLVCSPPAAGKTTFLRSIAHLLATGKNAPLTRVAVADERLELSNGLPSGGLLDILGGVPKGEAIEMLTRNMSPRVIVCDEIGPNEVDAVLEAQSSGVSLIASAHCERAEDLRSRGRMARLLDSGVFPLSVSLTSPSEVPIIERVGEVAE